MTYLSIFELEFEKGIFIFEINTRKIFLKAKFRVKTKILKSRTKNPLFGNLWAGIWKYYCHIWHQHPRICLIVNFGAEITDTYARFKNRYTCGCWNSESENDMLWANKNVHVAFWGKMNSMIVSVFNYFQNLTQPSMTD